MSSIFEDGYLKKEFINPNYYGNWPYGGDFIVGVRRGWTSLFMGIRFRELATDWLKIPQFNPQDIPVGEVVFGYNTDTEEWHKIVLFDQCYFSFGRWVCRDQFLTIYEFPTPYLIAETPERAEELKDWSKQCQPQKS